MAVKQRYIAVCENWPNANHPPLEYVQKYSSQNSYWGSWEGCTWFDKKHGVISSHIGKIDLQIQDDTPATTRAALKIFREQFICKEHDLPPGGVWTTYNGMYRGLAARLKRFFRWDPMAGWKRAIKADTIRKMW